MTAACMPPAAFSIVAGEANFCPAWLKVGRLFDVLLAGRLVTRVRAYDCTEGWVRRIQTDETGRIMLNEAGDAVAEEVLRGTVTVAWRADAKTA